MGLGTRSAAVWSDCAVPASRPWLHPQRDQAPSGEGTAASRAPRRVCRRPAQPNARGRVAGRRLELRAQSGAEPRKALRRCGVFVGSERARSTSRCPGARTIGGKAIAPHWRTRIETLDLTRHKNISVTTPILTLIDVATRLPPGPLEAAINEADKLDLVHPPRLRKA